MNFMKKIIHVPTVGIPKLKFDLKQYHYFLS